jgi:hypothetical protein
MGIFPLRSMDGPKRYATISPSTVAAGATFTVRDITVENLSSGIPFTNPQFRAFLVPTAGRSHHDPGDVQLGELLRTLYLGRRPHRQPARRARVRPVPSMDRT